MRSFIRNRHSQSPLSIQAHLFDHLLEHTKAFPRFKDFVLAFGRRRGEHEIGPSQLKFNPIQSPTGPAFG